MEVSTGRAIEPLARDEHLLRPVMKWAQQDPDRVMFAHPDSGRFEEVTASEFYARCRAVAKGLIASGVRPGDRVALMSATRLEWLVTDYAIMAVGGVTVPIYETSSAEQVQWMLGDSAAVLFVAETPAMRHLYETVAPALTACREVFVIDEGGLDELVRRGESGAEDALDEIIGTISVDDLATIVYTSGTTGRPKGCLITHRNLRTNVLQTLDAIGSMFQPDEDLGLQFLPLAHTLAKIITLVAIELGLKGAFCSNMADLPEDLATVRPSMVASVPRVFEKVFNGAQQKATNEGHGSIFDKAADVAVKWSQEREAGGFHPLTELEHAVLEQLLYKKVREALGGRLRFAFSGGGPLGERLTHFFNGAGIRIFEGYGLTETSPVLTVNSTVAWKPGTVGLPVAGTTIKIAPDGEILARGPQVFGGYWNNDVATSQAFDEDGWFKTGDIGALDEDGFLRITGRKKELIVTASGKNVAPAPLEDRLRAHPLISQAVVVGDNRPFIAALISIDEQSFAEWALAHGLGDMALADATDHPTMLSTVQAAIDATNLSVSRAESIRKFTILPRDLTLGDGELTPTLKVRRAVVEKSFAPVVDALYLD